jgi:opacity protein-like surface antigen
MAKRLVVAVGLALCASLASAATVRVTASRANVRSEPSVTGSVIGTVAQGRTLTVIVTVADWIKVTDGSSTGWIHKSLVEEISDKEVARLESAASAARQQPQSRPPKYGRGDEKRIKLGVGASFGTQDIGFGLHGRAIVMPVESMPALRGVASFDYFLGEGKGWNLTLNGRYSLGREDAELRPYVGGGLVFTHVPGDATLGTGGETATDLDLAAGVERERLFLEARLVLYEKKAFIISAGITF